MGKMAKYSQKVMKFGRYAIYDIYKPNTSEFYGFSQNCLHSRHLSLLFFLQGITKFGPKIVAKNVNENL
jgi:hypothetical protein